MNPQKLEIFLYLTLAKYTNSVEPKNNMIKNLFISMLMDLRMGFLQQKPGFATMAIHSGQDPEKWDSLAVVPPIVVSTIFQQKEVDQQTGYLYGRISNPSRNTLETCLASLDGGKYCQTFSSGLGAITTIFSLLSNGDHIVSCDDLYAGTRKLLEEVVTRMGVKTTFVDFTLIDDVKMAIRSNTKMIWIESPSNPTLQVIDIAVVSKLVKSLKKDIIVVVDNTFSSPYLQRPLDLGADITMYSLTKFMNGHSDVIMGAAIVKDEDLGSRLRVLQFTLGAVPSPLDCFLVNRSLKTLALRMEQHKKSSLIIAQWLEQHPKVKKVLHPGLRSHPQHQIAKKQMSGHSGVFSFVHTGGLKESRTLLGSLKIFALAVSLGGFESLAELPSQMTHVMIAEELKTKLGITDALIRLSVGLEDTQDLINDLDASFKAAF